jgi:peptidoglycan-N-acetylglucosamine deacetylase
LKVITTSWDDGHPLDFRLAELLNKYKLKGTFYIPKSNAEHSVMSEEAIQELAQQFEIGGHTLTHARLGSLSKQRVDEEVKGCYHWLTRLLGTSPVSFCFPGGVYNAAVIESVKMAGFKVLRTTELLSINPSLGALMPTTLQVYEHTKFTYLKHLVKRKKIINLLVWLNSFASSKLPFMVDHYLNKINKEGGCLHIWGHSWEIEENNLWKKLEQVFKQVSNLSDFRYEPNQSID